MTHAITRYCSFALGDRLFGIDVTRIQEILRWQPLTRVPLAPRSVVGLINLRGEIVPAIDVRDALGLAPSEVPEPINVVLRTPDGPVSLLVDRVDDVLELDREFDLGPEAFTGPARELIRGLFELDDRLLLILDTDAAIERSAVTTNGGLR